jgi:hypothetical protein
MRIKLIIIFLAISLNSFAQNPKMVYAFLLKNNTKEAFIEYKKFDSKNNYKTKKKILLDIAKCLLMIERDVEIYNPLLSVKTFNSIEISTDYQKFIKKFLKKYMLDLETINSRINNEFVSYTKLLNTIEAYQEAVSICPKKYRDELQNLLEQKKINIAKKHISIQKINEFISENPKSIFVSEAIDFRDSLEMINTTQSYNELKNYIQRHPNSKFNVLIENKLSDILFSEVEKSQYSLSMCQKFIEIYKNDKRINILDSISFNKAFRIDSVKAYNNYLKTFKNGIYSIEAINKINNKLISLDKINNCFDFDSLINYLKCENILELKFPYVKKILYLKRQEDLKTKAPKLYNKLNNKLISEIIGDGNTEDLNLSLKEVYDIDNCEKYLDEVIDKIKHTESKEELLSNVESFYCFPIDYSVLCVQGDIVTILEALSETISGASYHHYFFYNGTIVKVTLNDEILTFTKKKFPKIDWNNFDFNDRLSGITHIKDNIYKLNLIIGEGGNLANIGDYSLSILFRIENGVVLYDLKSIKLFK